MPFRVKPRPQAQTMRYANRNRIQVPQSVLTLAGLLLFWGGSWVLNSIQERSYYSGIRAYEAGDCQGALTKFEQFVADRAPDSNDPKDLVAQAQAKQAECQAYQKATTVNDPGGQLGDAAVFAQQYGQSGLLSPLREAIAPVAEQTDINTLTTDPTCQRLEAVRNTQLIPPLTDKLPQLYQTCGALFTEAGEQGNAIAVYEQFLDHYPQHSLADPIKQSYAKAVFDEANQQGAGALPTPGRSGATGDGSTVVRIRNNSPEKMRIVLSGPTPRVEELAPCEDCVVHTPSNIPEGCSLQGPEGVYTMQPGGYQAVVKSIGATVTPFTGNWALEGGSIYSHCFFMVRDPA